MSNKEMPVAEATVADEQEFMSYELAFHVLPTVAEGEVANAFSKVKEHITKNGGTIFDEETPERFDLAYDIVKYLEGRNRKFSSAYFGWVRFRSETDNIANILEEMESDTNILRHLLVRLTKVEEENPFRFHEALKEQKMITDVEEGSVVVPDVTTSNKEEVKTEEDGTEKEDEKSSDKEETGEVDESELDDALNKSEAA